MKKSLILLAVVCISLPAFADASNYHLLDSNTLNFAAPIVSGASNYTNSVPYGTIVYDAGSDQFKGLDRNGNWDAMSNPGGNSNVSSASSGQIHLEYANITAACTSGSSCSITSSAGITSITRSGTGAYTVNFPTGEFISAPACTWTIYGASAYGFPNVVSSSATANSYQVVTYSGTTQDVGASGAQVICMGPY